MLLALVLVACGPDPDAPPPRPDGLLEVLGVDTTSGEQPASARVLAAQPGCRWGRELWSFDGDRATLQVDALCAAPVSGEYHLCQVRAAAPATWNAERGEFSVKAARATARFGDAEPGPGASGERVACRAVIEAGTYSVARVYNGKWKWEIRIPSGDVLRLDRGEDRPDVAGALHSAEEAAP